MPLDLQDGIVVVVAGSAIIGVLWYFLGPRGRTVAHASAQGVQEVTIVVQGGYVPSTIEVDAGRPVRLTFDRRENNPCADEVMIGALGITRELPAFERTSIEFTPASPGRYEFTCGMGMLHGAVIAR